VLGGVLGSQVGKGSGKTAATIAGVLIGGYLGGSIGKTMDDNDRRNAYNALEHNPTNQPSSWRNPDTGNNYTVTPTKTYDTASGPCREYTTEVVIDGRRETATGTACRENGSWRIVN
jgi:surface antigen